MSHQAVPLLMILYANDAVEIRYSDNTSLQLSCCGSTMIHQDGQTKGKGSTIHKRSRFVTSEHRQKVLQALDFRNRFAERPYLCKELIKHDAVVALYANIESVSWPSRFPQTSFDILPDGSRRVTSLDEHASLIVSPHGHDFTVCYLSKTSADKDERAKHKRGLHLKKPPPGALIKSDTHRIARETNNLSYDHGHNQQKQDLKAKKEILRSELCPTVPARGLDVKAKEAVVYPYQHTDDNVLNLNQNCRVNPQPGQFSPRVPHHQQDAHFQTSDSNFTEPLREISTVHNVVNLGNLNDEKVLQVNQMSEINEQGPLSSMNCSHDISSISRSSTPDGLRTTIDSDATLLADGGDMLQADLHSHRDAKLLYKCQRSNTDQPSSRLLTSSPTSEIHGVLGMAAAQNMVSRESQCNRQGTECENKVSRYQGHEKCATDKTEESREGSIVCDEVSAVEDEEELDRTLQPDEENMLLLGLSRTVIGQEDSEDDVTSSQARQLQQTVHLCADNHPSKINPPQPQLFVSSATAQETNTNRMPDNEVADGVLSSACRYEYVWATSHGSRNDCPPAWAQPLKLALEGRAGADNHHENYVDKRKTPDQMETPRTRFSQKSSQGENKSDLPKPLPLTCPFQHLHKWEAGERSLNVSNVSANSLEFQHGLLKVVISEGIVYRFVSVAGIQMVEVHPGDGSIVVSQGVKGHFFTHYITVGDRIEERTYSLKSLPPAKQKNGYVIAELIKTASRYLAMNQQWERRGLRQDIPCWKREAVAVVEPLSSSLLEECVVDGLGKFTAFTNGRVRVVFDDRTALDMMCNFSQRVSESIEHGVGNRHQTSMPCASEVSLPVSSYQALFGTSTARLLLPSGQYVTVDIYKAGQYKRYIKAGQEWASWVNSSPLERQHYYTQQHLPEVMQSAAEHELKKIFCFNYILEQTLLPSQDNVSTHQPWPSLSPTRHEIITTASNPPSTNTLNVAHYASQTPVSAIDINKFPIGQSQHLPTIHSHRSIHHPSLIHAQQKKTDHNGSPLTATFTDQTYATPPSLHHDPYQGKQQKSHKFDVTSSVARSDQRVAEIVGGFDAVRNVLLRNSHLINDIDDFLDSSKNFD